MHEINVIIPWVFKNDLELVAKESRLYATEIESIIGFIPLSNNIPFSLSNNRLNKLVSHPHEGAL